MPPHLHPRSSATTTLFASTLAASFIIVCIPHIFPCPAPRKGYLDEDGKVIRRRRRKRKEGDGGYVIDKLEGPGPDIGTRDVKSRLAAGELQSLLGSIDGESGSAPTKRRLAEGGRVQDEEDDVGGLFRAMEEEAAAIEKKRRECPVPKPGGKIGEFLGFGRHGRRRKEGDER